MKTYGWDEIVCEIYEITEADPGWELRITYPNGVKEFRSDRNHLALECEAPDKEAAHAKFLEIPEYQEWMNDLKPTTD